MSLTCNTYMKLTELKVMLLLATVTKPHWEHWQRAKKVVSDSPGLVDFAIGLVNSVFNLPDGQVIFF